MQTSKVHFKRSYLTAVSLQDDECLLFLNLFCKAHKLNTTARSPRRTIRDVYQQSLPFVLLPVAC